MNRPHRRRLWDDISTVKTTYRPLRLAFCYDAADHVDRLANRGAILSVLLAQFLRDGLCAHCESAGCTTRAGTAHRQHGRLPVHGPERRGVSRWLSAQRGQRPGDAVGTGTSREDVQRAMTPLWLPTSGRGVERFLPMLLRITQRSEGDLTVVALAGHLVREGVAELERLCQAVPSPLALDLTYLWWADAAGITLLNTLADAGAQLRGVSPYIALLLGRSEA